MQTGRTRFLPPHTSSLRNRRTRRLWLSIAFWRRRLAFWGGALLVGLVAVGFAVSADAVQGYGESVVTAWPLLPLIATPLIFALSAWIALRFFPGSPGSGIPQAIAARQLHPDADRGGLLSLRVAAGKVALTLLGLAAGASIGREGPTVQVGAAIMLAAAGVAGVKAMRGIVLAGAAAGLAAAFNTPLAGIVFAIEEMARAYEQRTSGLVVVAVIIAGVAAIACLGNYEYFGHAKTSLELRNGWLPVLATGLIGGLMGGVFSRVIIAGSVIIARMHTLKTVHRIGLGAACGLVVAIVGVATGGATFGTGYGEARAALEGTSDVGLWYAPLKLLATAVSTLSGIPGGLFAPSLSIGAGIGSIVAPFCDGSPAAAVVTLGLVAYLVGVTQAPMTGFVIVMEMTGNNSLTVPLMATAAVAYAASRLICPQPLYHALALQVLHDARQKQRATAAKPPSAAVGSGDGDDRPPSP